MIPTHGQNQVSNQRGMIGLALSMFCAVMIAIVGGIMLMQSATLTENITRSRQQVEAENLLDSVLADFRKRVALGAITNTNLRSNCWRDVYSNSPCGSLPLMTSYSNYPPYMEVAAAYRPLVDSVTGVPNPSDGTFELRVLVKDKRTGDFAQTKVHFVNPNTMSPGVITFLNGGDTPVTLYPTLYINGESAPPPAPSDPMSRSHGLLRAATLAVVSGPNPFAGESPDPEEDSEGESTPPPEEPVSSPAVSYPYHFGTVDTRICIQPDLGKMKSAGFTFASSCNLFLTPLAYRNGVFAANTGTNTVSPPVPLGANAVGEQTVGGATIQLVAATGQTPQFLTPTTTQLINQSQAMRVPIQRLFQKLKDYADTTADGINGNDYRPTPNPWFFHINMSVVHGSWSFDAGTYPNFERPFVFYFNDDVVFNGHLTGQVNLIIAKKSDDPTQKTTVRFGHSVNFTGHIFMEENTQIIFEEPGKIVASDKGSAIYAYFEDPAKIPLISAPQMTFARSTAVQPIGDLLVQMAQLGQQSHTRNNFTFDLANFKRFELVQTVRQLQGSVGDFSVSE